MKPEIRFNGFSDEWVEKKLGDVVSKIQSGNRLPKSSLIDGDVPYVVAQTKNDGVLKKIARGTLDYNGNPMKLFPGNSISFSIDNPEAMFYRNAEFYTSNIMRVIHEDHLTHEQYVFILENMKRFTKGYDWTHKFSGPVVSNLEYPQPSKEEQQKIGGLFSKYDAIIALREQKLAELDALKKGLLQQMFPKNGSKVPELRFKGFADDWEEKKLGDVYSFSKGSGISKQSVLMDESLPKGIPYGDLFTIYTSVIRDVEWSTTDINGPISNGTEILIPASSTVPLGPAQVSAILQSGVRLGGDIIIGKPLNNNLSNIFVAINATVNKHKMYRFISGSTISHISASGVANVPIQLPTLPEQQKIGQLFKHLDDRISNEQAKIEQLKEQKQGLLQRMLTN